MASHTQQRDNRVRKTRGRREPAHNRPTLTSARRCVLVFRRPFVEAHPEPCPKPPVAHHTHRHTHRDTCNEKKGQRRSHFDSSRSNGCCAHNPPHTAQQLFLGRFLGGSTHTQQSTGGKDGWDTRKGLPAVSRRLKRTADTERQRDRAEGGAADWRMRSPRGRREGGPGSCPRGQLFRLRKGRKRHHEMEALSTGSQQFRRLSNVSKRGPQLHRTVARQWLGGAACGLKHCVAMSMNYPHVPCVSACDTLKECCGGWKNTALNMANPNTDSTATTTSFFRSGSKIHLRSRPDFGVRLCGDAAMGTLSAQRGKQPATVSV